MCGLAGVVGLHPDMARILSIVHAVQGHRGPDANGQKLSSIGKWQVVMVHQRLAVLDRSEAANQSMIFGDERGYLIYDGKIYNYKEIRGELEQYGYKFCSDSDTEVVLVSLHHWGIEKALNKFNGMWAFAWLNLENGHLVLARDRLGIKPLYYAVERDTVYFASEIKTLLEMASKRFTLNNQVVGEYLIQSLLDTSNETFFKGIDKIPAGNYCLIDLLQKNLSMQFYPYWELKCNVIHEENLDHNLIEKIQDLFFDSVRLRLRSDVPLGVLLSGGIDSSSIASATQNVLGYGSRLNLISAVSTDSRYDESRFISIMAGYIGQPVHKVILDLRAEEAFGYLEQVCWYNDEPVGSFSNVAHYLLMRKAAELGIKVILSGQGADELLCGYKKYTGFYIQSMLSSRRYKEALKIARSFWKQGTIINQFNLPEARRYLPGMLKSKEIDIKGQCLTDFIPRFMGLAKGMSIEERQLLDLNTFSVPVLTHYEDRMSMAYSREVRVPFLDYRIVELFLGLPVEMKINQGWTKYIFRKAMEPFLPAEIAWRKDKQGFVNPQSEWLKHELREEVLNHFEKDALIFRYGLVNRKNLLKIYEGFCKQQADRGFVWYKDVFNPLALEIWLRKYERYIA